MRVLDSVLSAEPLLLQPQEEGVALLASICLVLIFVGLSVRLYFEVKSFEVKLIDVEGRISDLEDTIGATRNEISNLEAAISEMRDKMNDMETRIKQLQNQIPLMYREELKVLSSKWSNDLTSVDLWVRNTGTAKLTITEIRVNGVANSTSPGWTGVNTLKPGQDATISVAGSKYFSGGFTQGMTYEFAFVTATGNQYGYKVTAPPFMTEDLKILYCGFVSGAIDVTVQNTGTAKLVIVEVRVDGKVTDTMDVALDPGLRTTIMVSFAWTAGTKYEIALITETGKKYTYVAVAP